MAEYEVKDSGNREEYASGMRRDTTEGKTDYALVLDGPLIERLAAHLTKGAVKYGKRNWMKAHSQVEYERFRESAFRHFMQYWNGATDEDHFAAVVFNLTAAEYVLDRLDDEEDERRTNEFVLRTIAGGLDEVLSRGAVQPPQRSRSLRERVRRFWTRGY